MRQPPHVPGDANPTPFDRSDSLPSVKQVDDVGILATPLLAAMPSGHSRPGTRTPGQAPAALTPLCQNELAEISVRKIPAMPHDALYDLSRLVTKMLRHPPDPRERDSWPVVNEAGWALVEDV